MAGEPKGTPEKATPVTAETKKKLRAVRARLDPAKAPGGNYVPVAQAVQSIAGVPVQRYAKTFVEDPDVPWPRAIFHEGTGTHVSPESFKKIIEHPDVKFEWVEKGKA